MGFSPKRVSEGESTGQEVHLVVVLVVHKLQLVKILLDVRDVRCLSVVTENKKSLGQDAPKSLLP